MPLYFFMWEFVKDKIYIHSWSKLAQLKRIMTWAIRNITMDTLKMYAENAQRLLHTIVGQINGHIEHV